MIRLRWYVGLSAGDGRPVTHAEQASCLDAIGGIYGGCTVYQTRGVWKGTVEDSLVYEVVTEELGCAPEILAEGLQTLARQSSVLWTRESVEGGFTA